jgi:hypothetical protein
MFSECPAGSGVRFPPGSKALERADYQSRAEHESLVILPFVTHGLEVLRQPLEDRTVTISRAQGSLTFPANFMLVGAQNPCPCGYCGNPEHACSCNPMVISRYQKRLSGPLLVRTLAPHASASVDIHIEVPRVPFQKLGDECRSEPSAAIRARIDRKRLARYAVAEHLERVRRSIYRLVPFPRSPHEDLLLDRSPAILLMSVEVRWQRRRVER